MKIHTLDSGYTIEVLGAGLAKDTRPQDTTCPWYLYNPVEIEDGFWMRQDEMDALISKIQEIIK